MNAPLAALWFFAGLMVGLMGGVFVIGMCVAASRNEEGR